MEVSFNAFHLVSVCPEIPLVEYLNYLWKSASEKEKGNQILYVTQENGFYLGVLLTIQDRDRFFTLKRQLGKIIVTEEQLEKGSQIADFNFFIIDSRSGIGIYQYYRKSYSLNKFLYRLSVYYNSYFKIKKRGALNAAQSEGKNKEQIKRIANNYIGWLKTSIVERKGKLEERIALLKDIYSVNYSYEEFTYDPDSEKNPLLPVARNINYEVALKPNVAFSDKFDAVKGFINKFKLSRASVKGRTQDGEDVVYKMFKDYDKFDSYDYDDLFTSMTIDSEHIHYSLVNNDIITSLISCFHKNKIHFGLL